MQRLQRPSMISLAWLCASAFLAMFLVSATPASSGDAEYMPVCNLPQYLNPQVTAKSGIGTANATIEAKVTPDAAAKWCAANRALDKYCPKEEVKMGGTGNKSLYRASADCVAGRMTPIDGNQYTYAGVWEDSPGKGRPRFTTTNPRFPHTKWDEAGDDIAPGTKGQILGWDGGSPNLAAQWEILCAGAPAPAMK